MQKPTFRGELRDKARGYHFRTQWVVRGWYEGPTQKNASHRLVKLSILQCHKCSLFSIDPTEHALSQASKTAPTPPRPKRRYEVQYYSLKKGQRLERMSFDPSCTVQDIRQEIQLRCSWAYFDLATRKAAGGAEFFLHDRDELEVVITADESKSFPL